MCLPQIAGSKWCVPRPPQEKGFEKEDEKKRKGVGGGIIIIGTRIIIIRTTIWMVGMTRIRIRSGKYNEFDDKCYGG